MKRYLILLVTLLFSSLAQADNGDIYPFDSVAQEQQYRHLTESLRCPKCQNNSIADSNAMIAGDMRLKVYQLLRAGQTPEQIKAYMVARYGHFVSYQPPLTPSTLILWAGPALFVLIGALAIVLRSRQRRTAPVLDAEQQRRLNALLHKNGKQS
ncbi:MULTISPECIES: cytochrome c-type biogenesis protein CcmH [Erwinia]|uniref:Cytochrome c-type biogenesis protein n=1 Tax=Erwinia pyrifoliae TaxID=79967 RepID=A0ABY5XAY1_ERWPY|nr:MULTISPECIES: cytochrome c-type biogenesis protein [Erwinia]ADP13174.1 Cytochrome c-type biogenesis protein [Erwinia sp. Ejp617]AUX73267.1 cytochrome c-type biogenesis protein CcmH [Erwinia pyrifoliae]MCA8876445.1 cytochrome c-type biogenesis protein CcmH [Erwinia pyrifoliae]MCT2386562.1 cytochrome c-type biogenesis protein CcmH [Erwinia pyrifoliae]MCU8587841.1 cytochrome c-type biogenesis protein CcmH [Erwinia pyrifoliae]